MSLGSVRDRWHLFAGAVVAVALGVGLVQSALQVLAATDRPQVPPGVSDFERAQIREGYAGAGTLLGMCVMLAVFLTVFVVSTTFGFAVAQRRRELGLLRLVGAHRSGVGLMLLGEALVLGIAGTAAGLPIGVLGTWIQSKLLIHVGILPPWFEAPWEQGALWVAAIVGLSTALAGVLAAAWRASRVSALEALADLPHTRPVMTGFRWLWGISAAAVTVLMVIAGQAAREFLAGLVLALGVMVCGSVALSQLSPVVVPLAGRLPALVLRGHLVADLARANVLHAVRRSAATAAPLIVLVALLVGLWGTFGSMAKAVGEEQRQLVTADLVIGEKVAPGPDFAAVSVQTTVPVKVTRTVGRKKRTEYSEAIGIDPPAFQRTHKLRPRKGSLDKLSGATLAIGPGMAMEGYKLGSTVTVAIGARRLPLKVVAVMPETLDVSENFYVPRALIPPGIGTTESLVKVVPGKDPRAVAARYSEVRTVQDWAEAKGEEQQRGNTGLFAVLMGLAGVYVAVAVVNAVVMAATDRRREFALARMAGLTRGQVIGVAAIESITVVVIGVLLGSVVAGAALAGIGAGTASMFGVVVLAIPWKLLGAILAASLVVVCSTAALTAWSATRQPPIALLGGRD
ncbi:putative ABC transport system permease protein [Kribbella amoyensis]|uniref:Putative ABC transport system permease protein n=1 Tax=Kribbella amoyensis TaxID=996641 RepID=A0A561BLY8_9ACTN|nr:ABC transporter permease [Kribbella amoyensis]TWD79891.1 putative ABC transport system permease protein [Kribbella amoyensis]